MDLVRVDVDLGEIRCTISTKMDGLGKGQVNHLLEFAYQTFWLHGLLAASLAARKTQDLLHHARSAAYTRFQHVDDF